jgi:prophage maintenance system killer protein
MNYIDLAMVFTIFEILQKYYESPTNQLPAYTKESAGVVKFQGCLESIKFDQFYPDFFSKATHLIVSINHQHCFSNGNKRLGLVTLFSFGLLNSYIDRPRTIDETKAKLLELFPTITNLEYVDFYPWEFGLYNISIVIADKATHQLSDDDLKSRVKSFLIFMLEYNPTRVAADLNES